MVYAAKAKKALKQLNSNNRCKKNYAKDTESYRDFSKSQLSQNETKKFFTFKKLNLDIFTTVGDIEPRWVKN